MAQRRQPQGRGDAESRRDAAESGLHVELEVLAGVNHIEACDPKHDGRGENGGRPGDFPANRRPGGQRRQHSAAPSQKWASDVNRFA